MPHGLDRGAQRVLCEQLSKTKNHRQGIAGGFGGLAKSRVRLLETKLPRNDFSGYLTMIVPKKYT
jgi:hypothetical protein